MNLGYDEQMPIRARHDVHEREREFILIDPRAWGLAAQDFREDVVGIIGGEHG
jgi:hypothetical protein